MALALLLVLMLRIPIRGYELFFCFGVARFFLLRIPIRGYESLFVNDMSRLTYVTNPYKGL